MSTQTGEWNRYADLRPRAYSKTRPLGAHLTCPACGAHHAVAIVYRTPDPALLAAAVRHEIVLGHSAEHEIPPNRQCRDCGHRWVAPRVS